MGLWKDQKDLLKAVTSPDFAELHQRSKQMERPGMLDGIRQANAPWTRWASSSGC
jgi:hypothetical protein